MAQDNKISMPAGFGGLMRFQEEYASKLKLKPVYVIAFIILIIVFRIFLGMWFG